MIDANDLINNLRAQYYKKGYKIDELPEIKCVHDLLERSNLPKGNLIVQLQNLILLKEQNTDYTAAGYNPKTNTITYSDPIDLVHELFHVASTANESETSGITMYKDGFGIDDEDSKVKVNFGLDEGITDMFAEMANAHVPCGYPFEKMCAELLRNVFGLQIFKGYFENSYSHFLEGFPEELRDKIEFLVSNLDEYQSLTKAIYSGDAFPEDVNTLEKVTEYILEDLLAIAETMGKERSDIIDFFTEKAQDSKLKDLRELIKIDRAIENLNNKKL